MNFPRFSIQHPVTVIMAIFVLLTMGLMALWELPTDMFPEITFPMLSVVTRYPAAAPEEVESLVTKPLEESLATINGVNKITSTSQHGMSMVNLRFGWEYNLDAAANDVRDSIQFAKRFLPEDCEQPAVVKIDLAKIPAWIGTMKGNRSIPALKRLADLVIKPRLSRIDGVAAVGILTEEDEEIEVEADPQAMERHGLGFNRLYHLLVSENRNIPAGDLQMGNKLFSLRTIGETHRVADLGKIPILAAPGGSVLRLDQLATIRRTVRKTQVKLERGGVPVLAVQIMKQSGKNSVQVMDQVNLELKKIRELLPSDVVLEEVFDSSEIIRQSMSSVTSNLLTGGLLAIGILYFFLRRLSLLIIIAIAIPLSLLMTFIPMYFLKYSLNTMSLGGLALGVGMLVDNAIVVLENIERHLGLGKSPAEAAEVGTQEVFGAIASSTLTTLAVFIPFLFTAGIAAKLFSQLGVTISAALLGSLFLACTLAPMMAAKLVKTGQVHGEPLFAESYRRLLTRTLQFPKSVMAGFVLLFVLSLAIIVPRLGVEFMPVADDGMIGSPFRVTVGSSMEETQQILRPLVQTLASDPRVMASFLRIGMPEGAEEAGAVIGLADANEGEFFIRLRSKYQRDVSTKQFIENIRRETVKIPGLDINLRQSGEQLFNSDKAAIDIQVYGSDLAVLKKIIGEVADAIRPIPGIRDVDTDLKSGKPELRLNIDREKAMQAGLNLPDIGFALRTAIQGRKVSLFRQDGDEMYIRLRGPKSLETDPEAVLDIPLEATTLRQVAKLERGTGEEKLFRERQMRRGTVFANYSERSLGEVIQDVKKALATIKVPEGYFLELTGIYEDLVGAGKSLLYVFILGAILVYMIMASQFESFQDPFCVFFSVPLAAIGMFAGLWICGQTINISSMLGLVILLGIAVNNAIVLIAFVKQLREEGMPLENALIAGPVARLRPVLMTTLTTVLGMVPLALAYGEGAEVQQPLAISIMFGLSFSTVLTLFVVPCLYLLLERPRMEKATGIR